MIMSWATTLQMLNFRFNGDSSSPANNNVALSQQPVTVPPAAQLPEQCRSTRISRPTNAILESKDYQRRETTSRTEGMDWATDLEGTRPKAYLSAADRLSTELDDFIACIAETKASHNIPHSYRHAIATDPDRWMIPMQVEMDTLRKKHTWDLVNAPEGANIMGSMWVYNIKWDGEGNRIKDKARLVGKGYTQQIGVDYNETWAGVTRLESVRMTAAIAAKYNLKLWRIDFVGAYLNSLTKEDIYMRQPEGFVEPGFEDHVGHDMGLKTRTGTRVWVWRVQVWVRFEAPASNPYPSNGFGGFFRDTNLFKSPLLVYTQAVIIFTIPESILPPTMAPAQSKIARPLATQPEKQGSRKRKVSSRVMDENFVGAETNVVTKRLKLSANATRAAGSTAEKCQASVEDVDDDENIFVNDSPKNPNVLLEPVNGSDNVDMDPAPELESVEHYGGDDDDDDDEVEIEETAEAELGQSI